MSITDEGTMRGAQEQFDFANCWIIAPGDTDLGNAPEETKPGELSLTLHTSHAPFSIFTFTFP